MPDSPHTADIVELKACPFCGGEAYVGNCDSRRYVACGGDRPCGTPLIECQTEAEAIAAWNTRTPDPEAAAEIKALRNCAVEVAAALQLLIERHGEHLPESAGEDIRRADFALGKLTAALRVRP